MHFNHFFLRLLAQQLRPILLYARLKQSFSQEKDELVLGFERQNGDDFWIKCCLGAQFSTLVFPDQFHRAGRNSVDLFSDLLLHEVQEVEVFTNERAIGLHFLGQQVLVLKLFGNRSNVILFQDGQYVSTFQKRLAKDIDAQLPDFHRVIEQDFDAFACADGNAQVLYPTLAKEGIFYLAAQGYADKTLEGQWELLQKTLQQLREPLISIIATPKGIALSIFPVHGEVLYQSQDPIDALNTFYSLHWSVGEFRREKNALIEILSKQHQKTANYLDTLLNQRSIRETQVSYEEIGNILMAYLHLIPSGAKSVVLDNFYNNLPVTIKLNAQLSGPENAENYYRKSKNVAKEKAQWESNIARKQAELVELADLIQQVTAAETRKGLKPYLSYLQPAVAPLANQIDLPFKQFELQGWLIWVGRNAKNNDLLTLKYAKKFDIWLHARDVAGSHVIIRNPQQKTVPKYIIEKAAELAAHFSKRASDSLCPVIVTSKKYVRKTKDLLPGMVIVDREEEVVLVKPTYWE